MLRLVHTCPLVQRSTVPTRNVNLTDELDRFVLAKVESGRYENAEVVQPPCAPLKREVSSARAEARAAAAVDEGTRAALKPRAPRGSARNSDLCVTPPRAPARAAFVSTRALKPTWW